MNAAGWTISIIAIGVALVLALRWERDRRAPRYEFMSAPWLAMAGREITEALSERDLDVHPFTLSEEFTDPPSRLGHGSHRIGFSVRVGHGRIDVGDRPAPDADLRIISDYSDAVEIARDPSAASADPAEAERRIAEGRLRIEGDPTRMPTALQQLDIHHLLAEHTA